MLAVGKHILGHLEDQALRMTSGFAGGVGGTNKDLCGAFSAGVMIIGAIFGRTEATEDDTLCQQVVKNFRDQFEEKLGALYCYQLRAEDYGSDGKEPCSVLVERASLVLLELMEENTKST